MTIEELEKKHDELAVMCYDLQVEINALKKAQAEDVKPIPPHSRWKPKEDERYYTILGDGEIHSWLYHAIDDDKQVIGRYSIGNVFRTEADVEFALERLKVLAEMREWAGKWDDGVALKYDGTNKRISTTFITFISPRQYTFGEMRFESQGDARKCIDAVGEDRIKKYYFMIP